FFRHFTGNRLVGTEQQCRVRRLAGDRVDRLVFEDLGPVEVTHLVCKADVVIVGPEDFATALDQVIDVRVDDIHLDRCGGLGFGQLRHHITGVVELRIVGNALGLRIDDVVRATGARQRGVVAETLLHLQFQRAATDMHRYAEFHLAVVPGDYVLVPGAVGFIHFVVDLLDDVEFLLVHLQVGFEDAAVADHQFGEVDVRAVAQAATIERDDIAGTQCRDGSRVAAAPDQRAIDLDALDHRVGEGGGRHGTGQFACRIKTADFFLVREFTHGFCNAAREYQG